MPKYFEMGAPKLTIQNQSIFSKVLLTFQFLTVTTWIWAEFLVPAPVNDAQAYWEG